MIEGYLGNSRPLDWRATIARYCPEQPSAKQWLMLNAEHAEETLFGGAAGGGKSSLLLMEAAKYVDNPKYSALILRRTFSDLSKAGAIMDRAIHWWSGKAKWNSQTKTFTFPSGAKIAFGYLANVNDELQYQGAEYQLISFDELTQFTEKQYTYLFSRLRPLAGVNIPLRMRSATNPGGPGHQWVKSRFVSDDIARDVLVAYNTHQDNRPLTMYNYMSRLFLPAFPEENPGLDAEQYRRVSLSKLDSTQQAQLGSGDWLISAGDAFFRERWFSRWKTRGEYTILHPYNTPGQQKVIPINDMFRFLTVDAAGTTKTSSDYTAICAWALTRGGDLILLHCRHERIEVPEIIKAVRQVYRDYKATYAGIEFASQGIGIVQELQRDPTLVIKSLSPLSARDKKTGIGAGSDKVARNSVAQIMLENGKIFLPEERSDWLRAVEGELLSFRADMTHAHDDIVDNFGYAAIEAQQVCSTGWSGRTNSFDMSDVVGGR